MKDKENVFSNSEVNNTNVYNAPTKSDNSFSTVTDKPIDKCPPGHYTSIKAGGNGHYPNDDCNCNDINNPSVTIPVSALILLGISAIIFIIVFTRKFTKKK